MKLGLLGLDFKSGNMGCQALAYAFYLNLPRITNEKIECSILIEGDEETVNVPTVENIKSKVSFFKTKSHSQMKILKREIKECDYVVDFTNGDSFSDIYGLKRMIKVSIPKKISIKKKTPLILGPQTYGPYNKSFSRRTAKYILKNAKAVCTRDEMSAKQVEELTGIKPEHFTDVAFMLPFSNQEKIEKAVGINVSGLLWSGGYTGDNQFGLKTNYQEYITSIIKYLQEENYTVHLIPHVITKSEQNIENDMTAINEIKEMIDDVVVAPRFTNPIEAKDYVATMEMFIGSRMHATIAGVSTKVPTIAFSYSRKFEGLYESIDYPYVINAKALNTDEAIEKTKEYIRNKEQMQIDLDKTGEKIDEKVNALIQWFSKQFN